MKALSKASFLEVTTTNRGLVNWFTGDEATTQQKHDPLNCRNIGQEEYQLRISFFILREPSVRAPNRRKALQTLSDRKQKKNKKVSQLERDKRLLVSAMKRKIHFSQKNGKPVDQPGEQLLEYPLSLCDNEGNPLQGQKSYFTKILETRYKLANPPIITPYLPSDWTPECSIVEGMFLINTSPLPTHTTLVIFYSEDSFYPSL